VRCSGLATATAPRHVACVSSDGSHTCGFTALNFIPTGPDTTEQAERLAREVLPAVRTAV
jgi:hypothetical protein